MNWKIEYRKRHDMRGDDPWMDWMDAEQGRLVYVGKRDAEQRLAQIVMYAPNCDFRVAETADAPTIMGETHKRLEPMHPLTLTHLRDWVNVWAISHEFQRSLVDGGDAVGLVDHMIRFSILERGVHEATVPSDVLTLLMAALRRSWDGLNEDGLAQDAYYAAQQEAKRICLVMAALLAYYAPTPDAGMFLAGKVDPEHWMGMEYIGQHGHIQVGGNEEFLPEPGDVDFLFEGDVPLYRASNGEVWARVAASESDLEVEADEEDEPPSGWCVLRRKKDEALEPLEGWMRLEEPAFPPGMSLDAARTVKDMLGANSQDYEYRLFSQSEAPRVLGEEDDDRL